MSHREAEATEKKLLASPWPLRLSGNSSVDKSCISSGRFLEGLGMLSGWTNVPCRACEVSRVLDPQCVRPGSVGVKKKQTLRRGRGHPLQGISPPNNESQQLKSGSVAGTMAPRRISTIACRLTPFQCATALRQSFSAQ